MDEDLITTANTLSKKQNGTATKSIMRPSRKSAEEHNKSRAKMMAAANAASKNGKSTTRPLLAAFHSFSSSFFSDDPYYCGLRARVPNFVNGKQQESRSGGVAGTSKPLKASSNSKHLRNHHGALSPPPPSRSTPNLQNLAQLPGAAPPFWWHSRLYPDSGIGGNVIPKS